MVLIGVYCIGLYYLFFVINRRLVSILPWPSHTTTKTTKKGVIVHTHYNFFFTTAKIFSFIYGPRFTNNFFGKIAVKIFVVCKGL